MQVDLSQRLRWKINVVLLYSILSVDIDLQVFYPMVQTFLHIAHLVLL